MLCFGDKSLLFKAFGASVAEKGEVLEVDAVLVVNVDEGIEFVLLQNFGIIGRDPVFINLNWICLILFSYVLVVSRRPNIIEWLIQVLIVNIYQLFDLFFNRLGII